MEPSSQSKSLCCFCRLPRARLGCDACGEPICRSCIKYLADGTFAMLSRIPDILSHSKYCPNCHDTHVEPALLAYNETLERAKNVGFWTRSYRGRVPVLKKARTEVVVEKGVDRDDVVLKLGFMAAELGFNGLIHGEVVSRKVRRGGDPKGYQSMEWSGHALPVEVDQEKIEREEFREANWRTLSHR